MPHCIYLRRTAACGLRQMEDGEIKRQIKEYQEDTMTSASPGQFSEASRALVDNYWQLNHSLTTGNPLTRSFRVTPHDLRRPGHFVSFSNCQVQIKQPRKLLGENGHGQKKKKRSKRRNLIPSERGEINGFYVKVAESEARETHR